MTLQELRIAQLEAKLQALEELVLAIYGRAPGAAVFDAFCKRSDQALAANEALKLHALRELEYRMAVER